jgi:hypothetical protein
VARFLAPRLRRFAEYAVSYHPKMAYEEWILIVNKMALAFELIATEDDEKEDGSSKKEGVIIGLDLFREYFFDLWD